MRSAFSPVWLLPLALVSPYIFIGDYGVTVFELLIVLAFAGFALPALLRGSFRLPGFLLVYLLLFFVGWMGALANGLAWNIPVGLWNLNFFYKMVLVIGGYYIGYRFYCSSDAIVTHRFFRIVIIGLGLLGALYPFLTYDQRFALLRIFYAGDGDIARLHAPRFPGLGVNGNIYSFMVFIFVVCSFDAYVRRRLAGIYPLCAFVVVLTAASKLVISLCGAAFLLILMRRLVRATVAVGKAPVVSVSRRALGVLFVLVVLSSGAIFYLTQTDTGARILQTVATVDRFTQALESRQDTSSFDLRFTLWKLGLERVQLAPVLGIVKHRDLESDTVPLLFGYPHNEFIAQWMFYGITGMLAHVFLVGTLLLLNLRQRATIVWPVLYLGLIAQMMFDGAFEYIRFFGMLFMIVGLNVRYLHLKALAKASDVDPGNPQLLVLGS